MKFSEKLESILEQGVNKTFLLLSFSLLISLLALISISKGRSVLPKNPAGEVGRTAIYLAQTGKISRDDYVAKYNSYLEISRQNPGFVYTQDYFALGANGALYPKHPLLISVLASGLYAVFGTLGFWIYAQINFFILLFSFRSILQQFIKPGAADMGTFILIAGTQIAVSSFGLSYDLALIAMMFAGLALAKRHPLWGSFLMGITALIRANIVLFLPILVLTFLPAANQNRYRWLLASLLGTSQALLLFMLLNTIIWGGPLTLPYHRLPIFYHGQMFIDHSHNLSLDTLMSQTYSKLFGPSRGLFTANPVLFLLPFAYWALRNRETRWFSSAALIAGLLNLLVIFAYSYWDSSVIGNRFLMPTVCLWLLPICIGMSNRLGRQQNVQ